MIGPRLLILTDHSKHSRHNSLYAIVRALHRSEKFSTIDIASRGNVCNKPALIDLSSSRLHVHQSSPYFHFEEINSMVERNLQEVDMKDYDFMFLRIPRPLPGGFFKHLLTCLPANRIFNNPLGIEKTGSKEYLLNFPEFTAPSKLCHTVEEVLTFAEAYDTVIKPLNDYGGHGIMRVRRNEYWNGNQKVDKDQFFKILRGHEFPLLAMKFLENVHKGDKRIVVAGDKVLNSTLRLPMEGNWLCNVAQGGTARITDLTEEEKLMVKVVGKELMKEGIVLYGIDTLEDGDGLRYLSEINTLSIGGIGPAEELMNKPLTDILVQELWKAMKNAI